MQAYRSRQLTSDADFWLARQFLVNCAARTPPGFTWDTRRWDGMRFHHEDLERGRQLVSTARLWETAGGNLAGIAHSDGPGVAALQTHPAHREQLEDEMLGWAEANLSRPADDGGRSLATFAFDHDRRRIALLAARGYARSRGITGALRVANLAAWDLVSPAARSDYSIRETAVAPGEYEKMAVLLNAAFSRTIHSAQEYANFVENAPSFRNDLNLIAVAADGSFAGHAGISVESALNEAVFEPVCTHPAHQRMGLASALFVEGLLRLRSLGARTAVVSTGGGTVQNAFCDSLGFHETYPRPHLDLALLSETPRTKERARSENGLFRVVLRGTSSAFRRTACGTGRQPGRGQRWLGLPARSAGGAGPYGSCRFLPSSAVPGWSNCSQPASAAWLGWPLGVPPKDLRIPYRRAHRRPSGATSILSRGIVTASRSHLSQPQRAPGSPRGTRTSSFGHLPRRFGSPGSTSTCRSS